VGGGEDWGRLMSGYSVLLAFLNHSLDWVLDLHSQPHAFTLQIFVAENTLLLQNTEKQNTQRPQ
jgi:hypothetical protein